MSIQSYSAIEHEQLRAHELSRPGAWLLAALVAVLVYLPWLGERSLWFPDEPDVAEPAVTMYKSGDWVVPRQNDEPWLDYPPLIYWLGAGSGHLLGGPSPLALRLPVALMAVLLVALTARVAQALEGWHVGLWSGITLATAPQFALQAVHYHPDMVFAGLSAGGIGLYAWGVVNRTGWSATGFKVAGFACFGGAILAKGPLGLLLPGLVLAVWHASQRQWRALLWMAPLGLVSMAVAAPWYVLLGSATSWQFVGTELYLQNFARFDAANRGHEQPWWYYFEVLWPDWAPWSLLLPPALVLAFRRGWSKPFVRLALIWFLATLIFLTLAATKREVYLLPAYPAIAFLLGAQIARLLQEGSGRLLRWFSIAVGGIAVVGGVAGIVFAVVGGTARRAIGVLRGVVEALPSDWPRDLIAGLAVPVAVLGTGLCVAGLVLLELTRRRRLRQAFAVVVGLLVFFYTLTFAAILPGIDDAKSYRSVAVWLRNQSAEPIGYYPWDIENKRAGFRVEDPAFLPLKMLPAPKDVAAYLARPSRVVVLQAQRSGDIAAVMRDWHSLPKREIQLGSHRFLAVGPRHEGEPR